MSARRPRRSHTLVRLAAGISVSLLVARAEGETAPASGPPCAPDNGGIALPMGFCATVFADGIGHARNLVVSPQGVVYVNTWSGRYYGSDKPHVMGRKISDTSVSRLI